MSDQQPPEDLLLVYAKYQAIADRCPPGVDPLHYLCTLEIEKKRADESARRNIELRVEAERRAGELARGLRKANALSPRSVNRRRVRP